MKDQPIRKLCSSSAGGISSKNLDASGIDSTLSLNSFTLSGTCAFDTTIEKRYVGATSNYGGPTFRDIVDTTPEGTPEDI